MLYSEIKVTVYQKEIDINTEVSGIVKIVKVTDENVQKDRYQYRSTESINTEVLGYKECTERNRFNTEMLGIVNSEKSNR